MIDKRYKPEKVEEKIYQMWEKGGYFSPKLPASSQQPPAAFTITLPPPNVTGGLHAGHAMYVLEDILVRFQRMRGVPTLWLPGFDHASIAVSAIINRQLAKRGQTRHQIGREKFLQKAEKFAQESREYIRTQLKKIGFSLDWSREAYTMDKIRNRAVAEAFVRLYKAGLIYRGERLINWCPNCKTVISDLENEYREEKGKLYFIKYGAITIATSRPETMFADVAVAVHPKDKRYQNLIGKKVPLPLSKRQIPIIADFSVDPKFGSGALKITPAHDPLDFEIGTRHNLEKLTVIDFEGKLTALSGKYQGLTPLQAREKITQELKKKGFLEKVKEHQHKVAHCQRCGSLTEPLLSKQWFVKTNSKFKLQGNAWQRKLQKVLKIKEASLAQLAILAVKRGFIKIIPRRFEKIYFHWLLNIHDWCISRQLWWGHRIPVFYCIQGGDWRGKFVVAVKKPKKCPFCQKCQMRQDPDVLDTWFSSSLWPFSVFGWPKKTSDYQYFYPTTLRETGYDILFFWVAREIMMALFLTGKIPYQIVYLHGLVRDEKGRKFSKSKGIGWDPLEAIEKYGADALRMSLVVGTRAGNDLKVGEEKIKGYRNFANKIWNIGRFVLMHKTKLKVKNEKLKTTIKNLKVKEDKELVKKLNTLTRRVTKNIENFRFSQAAKELYHFTWHEFADKYLESFKSRRDNPQSLWTLNFVFLTLLKLLHPFMPFLTEELWQIFGQKKPLIISPWPKVKF